MKLTDIINERMISPISSIEAKGEGQVAIKFTVDNSELTSGFFVREIGIFAKINEGGEEKLYAYTNAGNYTNYLADNKTPIDAIITKIDLAIGNATDINFTVDKSIVYVSLEDLETNLQKHNSNIDSHEEAFTKHNADEDAHDNLIKKLFGSAEATLDSIKLKIKDWAKEVCLPLSGGTMKGNINASGYNITATKFIGNLQGKADSAANADLAAKATTAENANNANNSSVANKLGTSTVGSATKPVYINNGVASAVSVDLSTLAPKESPAFTGTPTAPTPETSDNSTKMATTAFVKSLFTASKQKNGWWHDNITGFTIQWGSGVSGRINYPISFPTYGVPIFMHTSTISNDYKSSVLGINFDNNGFTANIENGGTLIWVAIGY